jgi:hypothetical protein
MAGAAVVPRIGREQLDGPVGADLLPVGELDPKRAGDLEGVADVVVLAELTQRAVAAVHLVPVAQGGAIPAARGSRGRPSASCGLVAKVTASSIPACWRRSGSSIHSCGRYGVAPMMACPRGVA